jgi:DNA-binding transcriptional MerR regulator
VIGCPQAFDGHTSEAQQAGCVDCVPGLRYWRHYKPDPPACQAIAVNLAKLKAGYNVPPFTTTQAASQLQTTASTIRNYCRDKRFTPYLSAGATPQAGQTRRLSDSDLQAIRFIRSQEAAGAPLDEIAQRLAAGEHKDVAYTPEQPQEEAQPANTALVLASAMGAQLEEYRTMQAELVRELIDGVRALAGAESRLLTKEEQVESLEAHIASLEEQVQRLTALLSDKEELARLQAQLSQAQQQQPGLLRRLLGKR